MSTTSPKCFLHFMRLPISVLTSPISSTPRCTEGSFLGTNSFLSPCPMVALGRSISSDINRGCRYPMATRSCSQAAMNCKSFSPQNPSSVIA
uniref:Uncharacterized protein n=1 Tax=Arundo donax TaxID=35708 RepID=A0A0A8YK03_ARUDO